MISHEELLAFDPNIIIHLLNIKNNYFKFGCFIFHQTTGTAMGASFSPTVANIFMSVLFKNFLRTTKDHPLLLKRYIDDIFFLWYKKHDLNKFTTALNKFHPNIKFTMTSSNKAVNYLDITIYKGQPFN